MHNNNYYDSIILIIIIYKRDWMMYIFHFWITKPDGGINKELINYLLAHLIPTAQLN